MISLAQTIEDDEPGGFPWLLDWARAHFPNPLGNFTLDVTGDEHSRLQLRATEPVLTTELYVTTFRLRQALEHKQGPVHDVRLRFHRVIGPAQRLQCLLDASQVCVTLEETGKEPQYYRARVRCLSPGASTQSVDMQVTEDLEYRVLR